MEMERRMVLAWMSGHREKEEDRVVDGDSGSPLYATVIEVGVSEPTAAPVEAGMGVPSPWAGPGVEVG